MLDKLMRIATDLESIGRHEMADCVDNIMIKIAAKSELNPFGNIITQERGQYMPQLGLVEFPDASQSYRGQGVSRPYFVPDIARSNKFQELKRLILEPIDPSLSPQEKYQLLMGKEQAKQEMNSYVAQMQGKQIQSYWQNPGAGRMYDIMGKRLKYLRDSMGGMVSNPYQVGQYQPGVTPTAYGMAPSVRQPWIAPQSAPYYNWQYSNQFEPFASAR